MNKQSGQPIMGSTPAWVLGEGLKSPRCK